MYILPVVDYSLNYIIAEKEINFSQIIELPDYLNGTRTKGNCYSFKIAAVLKLT